MTVGNFLAGGKLRAGQRQRFLSELANLQGDMNATRRLKTKFADVLPDEKYLKAVFGLYSANVGQAPPTEDQIEAQIHRTWMIPLRNWVRSVWLAPDYRTRVWLIHKLISAQMFVRGDVKEESRPVHLSNLFFVNGPVSFKLEAMTPFEECLWYLLDCADRLRCCSGPTCQAPYFIAARRNQKYCVEECATDRQRQFKRQWWTNHGRAWRKRQAREQSRSGRKGPSPSGQGRATGSRERQTKAREESHERSAL